MVEISQCWKAQPSWVQAKNLTIPTKGDSETWVSPNEAGLHTDLAGPHRLVFVQDSAIEEGTLSVEGAVLCQRWHGLGVLILAVPVGGIARLQQRGSTSWGVFPPAVIEIDEFGARVPPAPPQLGNVANAVLSFATQDARSGSRSERPSMGDIAGGGWEYRRQSGGGWERRRWSVQAWWGPHVKGGRKETNSPWEACSPVTPVEGKVIYHTVLRRAAA